ncbi:MAG TPA: MogA/MoaB family molybdenum cofactor biosynthesis protein [Gemmatimonadales bacterium]|nr:MogA/MoaB family molybdenum cofactor biosynthesis protein [Gemmatimonadales bacterium]
MRVAILTVSDSASRGARPDLSGPAIREWALKRGDEVAAERVVRDDIAEIAGALTEWADGDLADVILTTGGTGLAPRDVTPEATQQVIERFAPGIAEALRFTAFTRVPNAALSRGLSGVRGRTLIINLPGSPRAVREGLEVLDQVLNHAVAILRGDTTSHETA